MPASNVYRIYPCGDHAITLELGDTISVPVNEKVMSLFEDLQARKITGVRDVIPAYHTITLVYDLLQLKAKYPNENIYEKMKLQLEQRVTTITGVVPVPRRVRIPVCYDQEMGPDLLSLAESKNISTEELIQIHTGASYRVYMIGFLPGFAYMGSVDKRIQAPRKAQPRTSLPAGSVGIAGEQTGIYPFQSPGGWQLIGRTPIVLFDAKKEMPCYLQPGDEVSFYRIDAVEFEKLSEA